MLTHRQKLELIADLLEYPESERDLAGAPESIRNCANYIFELETKIQAQNETLNGVRMLLDIPLGKSLLQAIQRFSEGLYEDSPRLTITEANALPLERNEIKLRLDELEIPHKGKDSTKSLFKRLVRTLKDKDIIDNLISKVSLPPSQKPLNSF